jgi:uncharacterized protein (UPF0332 family)
MVFDWLNYYDLAQELQDGLPTEPAQFNDVDHATVRCIISRAYYAAYWYARRYLETTYRDFSVGTQDAHLRVLNKMQESSNPEVVSIADQLDRLRQRRIKADYKIKQVFSFRDSESTLLTAREIMNRISNL